MRADVYWIEGPWPGRLAILARPRGGDWLEDEIRSWRRLGFDSIVSLLTPEEVAELDLVQQADLSTTAGLEHVTFPIPDRGTPAAPRAFMTLVRQLAAGLADGKHVGIHCRAGIGRSALLAACVLASSGLSVSAAFERVQAARGCPVPDTPEQRDWASRFVQNFLSKQPATAG